MPYWQLYYHIVWATHARQALLTGDIESFIYETIRNKAVGLKARVYAIGGIEDHLHLIVSIPPSLAIARFVGQVKGISSAVFNKQQTATFQLRWQDDYSVFSFSGKQLERVIQYVNSQKMHHADSTIIPLLERVDEYDADRVHESSPMYITDDDWFTETPV